MTEFAKDIYTEPTPIDVNTLVNLGPLRAMEIQGQAELFHHTDKNLLVKVAEPTPNPLAR